MNTPQTQLDLIDQFLAPVMEKQAASESYQDSPSNDVVSNEKKTATDKQTNLGVEQAEDAKDGGSTVADESDNSDELGKTPLDNQGTVTMDIDSEVVSNGNIGKIVHQEIGQNQKTACDESARIAKLANGLMPMLQKKASELNSPETAPVQKQATIEKTATDLAVDAATDEFATWYRMGMDKRAADEAELSNNKEYAGAIQAMGGASAVLDKLAMEDAESLIPAEALAPEMGGEAAPMMPEMGGEEAPAGDAEIEAIAQLLAENGVTEEDIAMAMADQESLEGAGVEAPELAEAIGGEEAAPAVDPAAGEGEVEKLASDRKEVIQSVRQFIYRNR